MANRFRHLFLLLTVAFCALFSTGCGIGDGSDNIFVSPAGPSTEGQAVWTTTLPEVNRAIAAAGGSETAWIASNTWVTLNYSQEQARIFCGLLDEPFPASATVFANTDIVADMVYEAASKTTSEVASGTASGSLPQNALNPCNVAGIYPTVGSHPAAAIILPAQFSWAAQNGKNWVTPVRNQGPYGTCVSFATVGAIESQNRIVTNNASFSIDLSEWDLWFNGTNGKNPRVGGWALGLAAEFLVKQGIVAEDLAPYSMIPVYANPPTNSTRYGITTFYYVKGRDSMKQALLRGPVVSGMDVYADFFYYKAGIYRHLAGPFLGGHAVLIIGFDDSKGCWIAKNSWSQFWGEDGLFRVAYDQTRDSGYLFSVPLPQPTPTPTPIPTPTPTPGPGKVPIILELAVSGITTSTAIISWKTDRDTDARVEYGYTTYYGTSTQLLATPTALHQIILSGLTTGSTYHFRVHSRDASASEVIGSDTIFTTYDLYPPKIASITVADISGSGAAIIWLTDKETTTQVDYGRTITYGSSTPLLSDYVTEHLVRIENLVSSTTWRFRIRVKDRFGREVVSQAQSFATLDVTKPIISALKVRSPGSSSAGITWVTDEPATTRVEYGPTSDYGLIADLGNTFVSVHQIIVTGLSPASPYHYRVFSSDIAGNEAISPDATFTTTDPNPPILSNIFVDNVTSSTALISWTTDEPANGQIDYGIPSSTLIITPLQTSYTMDHRLTVTNLKSETTYRFRVRSSDPSKNVATSSFLNFTTPDVTPPVITSAVSLKNLTATGVTLLWTTNENSTSQVEYGTSSAYGIMSLSDENLLKAHSVALFDLIASTTYRYRVRSKDASGNERISSGGSFTTIDPNFDPNLPKIGLVSAVDISGSGAAIIWTTDKETTAQVDYGRTITFGSSTPILTNLVTEHLVRIYDLVSSTTWRYRVRVKDAYGREVFSQAQTFSTLDVTKPLISAFKIRSPGSSSVNISWATDEPATTRVEYGPTADYGLSADLGKTFVSSHQILVTGLSPSSLYHYRVSSRDVAGNEAFSEDGSFTTTDPNPPVISDSKVNALTSSTAAISWTTDEPADGQIDYGIGSSFGTTTPLQASFTIDHLLTLTSLKSETTYQFRIRSSDPSKNMATSKTLNFTTPDVTPPVISAVYLKALTASAATVLWTTNEDSTSQVEYGTSSAYGIISLPDEKLTKAHSLALFDLAASTTYRFRVRSKDASGNERISPESSFNTLDPYPPSISNVQVITILSSSATIIWSTDEDSTSQVEYGTTPNLGNASTLYGIYTKNHSVTVVGLQSETTYYFHVKSLDRSKNLGTSDTLTFLTPDVTAPIISGVAASLVTGTGALINWTTGEDGTSQVDYGLTKSYGYSTALVTTPERFHSIELTGLVSSSTWHFRVRSKDATGNERLSTDSTFITLDITAPTISDASATAITSSTVKILWTTDENADGLVDYGPDFAYGSQSTKVTTFSKTHSATITKLQPDTTYHFRITSADSSKNTRQTNDLTFRTVDISSPVLSAISHYGATGSSVTISWKTNELATSKVNYGLTVAYESLPKIDSSLVTDHSLVLSGLTSSTTYHFRVTSADATGNATSSLDFTFNTLDGVAPLLMGPVTISNIGSKTATINWTTNEPSDGLVEYGTTTSYGHVTLLSPLSSTTHSLDLSGLTSNTFYHVRIHSKDPSENELISGDYAFSTLYVTLPIITDVRAVDITTGTARIVWTTDKDSTSQIEYGPSISSMSTTTLDASYGKSHSVSISGLESDSTYVYCVHSIDAAGNEAVSNVFSFPTQTIPWFISSVDTSLRSDTTATVTWYTGKISNSEIRYGRTSALGASVIIPDYVKSHAVQLSGLIPDTLYYFQARSLDSSGGEAVSPIATFTTFDLTGPTITLATATEIGSSTALMTWSTSDEKSTSQVEFGVTSSYGSTSTLDATLVNSHRHLVTGLSANLIYHYRVKSADKWGNVSYSADLTFKTLDVFIFNAKATAITKNAATITWTTDEAANSRVDVGVSASALVTGTTAPAMVTAHTRTITGLTANNVYYFQAVSVDSSGNTAKSPIMTFKTLP
ncbi:MAG: fibronectin type III domain-containing protein [Candidatus Ozemobacteraceae bacterium]